MFLDFGQNLRISVDRSLSKRKTRKEMFSTNFMCKEQQHGLEKESARSFGHFFLLTVRDF